MARALPPASFVREAPNNQSEVPVTATRHCPVPVLPRRAKTLFPGREVAPLRFAASSAWVQKGSRAGLRSANASAVTPTRLVWGHRALAWATATATTLAASASTRNRKEAGPATPGNGFSAPFQKGKTAERVSSSSQEESVETRCRCCPVCPAFPTAAVLKAKGGAPPPQRSPVVGGSG